MAVRHAHVMWGKGVEIDSVRERSDGSGLGDGLFKPKTAEGVDKLESQWTPDERIVVNQDQHLKSIIISCLPDDIMELVISHETVNDTWTDLDFQEKFDDEADERTSEEYLRDLDIEFHERASLKKILGGEQLTESSSKNDVKDTPFVPASLDYDNEMVPKSKDWVERLNPDSKLPNFNTKRILVSESEAVNECLKLTEGASPSSEVMTLTYQDHSPRERFGLGTMKHTKPKTQKSSNKNVSRPITVSNPELPKSSKSVNSSKQSQDSKPNGKNLDSSKPVTKTPSETQAQMTSNHDMYVASLRSSQNYKAQPYQYASPSKQILKSKAKPFPPCTHYGFNDHHPDDCRNYPKCKICGSYDHCTLEHNRVFQIRGGVLAESSQYSESSIRQNGVAERKNRTLIEAARTMLNGSILSKHFWTEAVRIVCYTQNRPVIVKRHDRTPYETFRERIPNISYFHVFGYLVFIHNHKDHLGKFDEKADDGSDISYYIIPHGRSHTELTQEKHVPEVIAPNESDIPHTEDAEGPPDLINPEETHEKKSMLTRIMAAKLTAASASECLFADFLFEIELKKVSEALKHPGWVDAMQEELNQFYRNKVWTLEEGIDYDETFAPVARMEAIRIFLAFATYMNFTVFQMDVKSALLNGKLKEKFYVKQPPGFESSAFLDYACKLDKSLYGPKQAPKACEDTNGPPNNLGHDLAVLYARYQSNPKESHLIAMKRILKYLKGTPTLGLYYPKCSRFNLKRDSDSGYAGCNMDRKITLGASQILGGKLVCWSAKKQQLVAMFSPEAEYVADAGCCANILWMKSQLSDYDIHYKMVPIFCDNTSAISISNNPVLHSRTKHIDIRYHFIRDHILKVDIELYFIPIEYQLADIFTKPLDKLTFTRLKAELGVIGEWFKNDCIDSVTTWEELVEKFVQKFYQLSYDNEEIKAEEDDDPDDVADIFKIKGNLFDYETPLCKAFNKFNYLLKIDTDLFTFDIQGIGTYEEYELNNPVIRDLEEPWLDNRVPYQLCDHICKAYHFKNGITKWPMCSSNIDGLCNVGELPGMVQNVGGRNYDTSNSSNTQDNQGHEERRDDPTHEPSVCKIKMMKYSFNADEEYIAIKESEYLNHSKDNLDAYRELLRIINEVWVVATLNE
ncbi:retrovirus-related pol polyprotein from transposon TNT 1-94 [Tanacetum coccineum]|uniref:Retrovirus-related pol polyprotein from transposon TNT 1-94 n=1 Tax=Tanacetum coccineum TaxID=301880 RepID=A0ABQ5G2C2_9ASTR